MKTGMLLVSIVLLSASALAQQAPQPALENKPVATVGQQAGAPKSENDTAAEAHYAADLIAAIKGVEAATRQQKSEADKDKDKRQEDREITYLGTQQDMVVWTKLMFWTSFAGGILTSIGAVFIWFTLVYNRRSAIHAGEAVAEARKATEAALSSVEITRNFAVQQLRPYITVTGGGGEYHLVAGQPISIKLQITNCGQTPASDVVFRAGSVIRTGVWTPDTALFGDEGQPQGVLMPGQEIVAFTVSEFSPDQSNVDQIRAGIQVAYLFGIVGYRDGVGGVRRETHFCFAIDKNAIANSRLRISATGNKST